MCVQGSVLRVGGNAKFCYGFMVEEHKKRSYIQEVREQGNLGVIENNIEMVNYRVRSDWTKTSSKATGGLLMDQVKRVGSLDVKEGELSSLVGTLEVKCEVLKE